MFWNITVMGNYLVVLLLSVFVLLAAFYVNKVEQNIVQIKDELLQHRNEIKKGKEELVSTKSALIQVKLELESTNKAFAQAQVELESTKYELKQVKVDLESTRNEVTQVKVELKTTKNELKQVKVELDPTRNELKQVKVELVTTKEQINKLRSEMIEKDTACKKEINQIRADLIALPEGLNKIKTEISAQRPGFYATLSPHTDLGHIQTIKFDKKITDVKNNYNTNTGVFTVPINGLYHISVTMFSDRGSLHADIMQNGKVVGQNFGSSSYVSAAINVVISCHKGDAIYVRHASGEGTENIHGYGYSAFSGFLIH